MVDYITVMSPRHVVVDGSNIATEGRTLPSLAQLDQAVREYLAENPDDIVTVVVDASFGHRIDSSELPSFEEAEAAAEVVSPPAGAIGRGDAFLLRIAEKTGAMVLSNDSFQEFHGEHEWLFDKGRLIGGKPVPGVGWIFTPRTPVRGAKSREAVKEAKRRHKSVEVAEGVTGLDLAASRKGRGRKVEKAIATATDEATGSGEGSRRRRRRGSEPPSEPVNAPLAFINFIAAHRPGSQVEGTVESFSSHGAFVTVEGATCYLPLSAMADPPPNRAREVVQKGEIRSFVVQAFDPQRRGVELAIPGFENLAAGVTEETVEAEIDSRRPEPTPPPVRRRRTASKPAAGAGEAVPVGDEVAEPAPVAAKRAPAKRAPAKEAAGPSEEAPAEKAPTRKAPAKRAPAKRAAGPSEEAPSEEGSAEEGPAEKGPAEKAPAKRAPAKRAPANKAAGPSEEAPAKRAPAKKAPAKRAPAKRAAGPSEEAPAKKAAGPSEEAPAKKAPTRKAPAKKAPAPGETPSAKRTPAKKAPAGGAPVEAAPVGAARRSRRAAAAPAGGRAAAAAREGRSRTTGRTGPGADPAEMPARRSRG